MPHIEKRMVIQLNQHLQMADIICNLSYITFSSQKLKKNSTTSSDLQKTTN